MRDATWSVRTGVSACPSTETSLSPARSPAACAAEPGFTDSTVDAIGTPSANTTARSATANTRFVTGPAAMTETRFQIGERQ